MVGKWDFYEDFHGNIRIFVGENGEFIVGKW
jgi:hypothetical protein